MRFFPVLVALTALCLSPWAFAQEGYPNSCDLSKPRDCFLLAKFYSEERGGFPPFPIDTERSAKLKHLAFSAAQKGCRQDRVKQCLHLILLAPDDDIGLDVEDSVALIIDALQKSEELCLTGNIEACELFDDIVKENWPTALNKRHPDLANQIKEQAKKYNFSTQRLIASNTIHESERQCLSGSRQACANYGKALIKFYRGARKHTLVMPLRR
ncbi:hypothetical protein [Roseovarius phycicola]|uniref:Lysozyme inhibitor LprI N-terminal domain-containing protein n=1 Tax=Roseovarius phycicola TaxID=3080976 RepID=A0ABZ2HQA3_9RHOB